MEELFDIHKNGCLVSLEYGKMFRTLEWRETIRWGIISGRSFTGYASGNAFSFDNLLISVLNTKIR